MGTFFWTLVAWVVRGVLSLRYRFEVRGLGELKSSKMNRDRGILFLPNHPALMDPLFLAMLLWPRYRMRPLAVEYIYRTKLLKPLMKLVGALPIPNFETSVNQLKVHHANQTLQAIVEGLNKGQNFWLYPAGRLKSSAEEVVGGSSATKDIIQRCPDVNVVLVRTTGLWGSSFSRALTGRSPNLGETIVQGVKNALKSLIFFMPRRRVLIEVEAQPVDLPRRGDRLELNRYLERWYNRYEDEKGVIHTKEPLSIVSYSCWHSATPIIPKQKENHKKKAKVVSEETKTTVTRQIAKILEQPGVAIRLEMNLALDLGMDSLQIAELIAFLGQKYSAQDLHPEQLETVEDALQAAEGAYNGERRVEPLTHPFGWPPETSVRRDPLSIQGATIPEAFLNMCQLMKSEPACADDLVGVLSYKTMKRSVLVLAEEFRKWPDVRIGVLLPASVATVIVSLAIQMAGKTPVMMNWTLGARALDGMAELSGVQHVISSWRFMERVSHVDFGQLVDSIVLIEDIREGLSFKSKLLGFLRSFFRTQTILRSMKIDREHKDDHAVILFTSGTEAVPKGVPLTHENILSDLHACLKCIDVSHQDVLYGILPPFHSFGFVVCSMFPILAGVRIAFYPDPTDSFALAEGIDRWRVTFFISAPTFLKGLLAAAKRDQLDSVRYFVVGAEKCSEELYKRVIALNTGARVIEGYGITECSPVLSLTRPDRPPKGVGQLLPIVDLCIIHSITGAILPSNQEGEMCVRGPNVFHGYIGHPRPAFVELEGKQWYRTGDIGFLDSEGNVIISGRIKRFAKIGGEMISLGAIESVLTSELIRQKKIPANVPAIAILADERNPSKPIFILISTPDCTLDLADVNEILKSAGFSRLVKLSQIHTVREIPLLGIGKTDYRSLQNSLV